MILVSGSIASDRSGKAPPPLPGWSLGLKTFDAVKVAQRLKRGLPYQSLARLARNSELSPETIGKVTGIPQRTLARRKAQGKLTPHESERVYRLALIFEKTLELFEEDVVAARQWLTTPARGLANHTPLEMVETEIGAREVENLIGRLEHGVFP